MVALDPDQSLVRGQHISVSFGRDASEAAQFMEPSRELGIKQ
jgi:hypothetical protein